jgi:AmiR/NasT family two-component response regulator
MMNEFLMRHISSKATASKLNPASEAVTPSAVVAATAETFTLEEQKVVDTACDILQRQRNLNHAEAYSLLTEMSEKRKTSLPEIALQLVEISKMLTI